MITYELYEIIDDGTEHEILTYEDNTTEEEAIKDCQDWKIQTNTDYRIYSSQRKLIYDSQTNETKQTMNLHEKLKHLDENPDDVLELNQKDTKIIQQLLNAPQREKLDTSKYSH